MLQLGLKFAWRRAYATAVRYTAKQLGANFAGFSNESTADLKTRLCLPIAASVPDCSQRPSASSA